MLLWWTKDLFILRMIYHNVELNCTALHFWLKNQFTKKEVECKMEPIKNFLILQGVLPISLCIIADEVCCVCSIDKSFTTSSKVRLSTRIYVICDNQIIIKKKTIHTYYCYTCNSRKYLKSYAINMKIRRLIVFLVHVFILFAYHYQFIQIHCSQMCLKYNLHYRYIFL